MIKTQMCGGLEAIATNEILFSQAPKQYINHFYAHLLTCSCSLYSGVYCINGLICNTFFKWKVYKNATVITNSSKNIPLIEHSNQLNFNIKIKLNTKG